MARLAWTDSFLRAESASSLPSELPVSRHDHCKENEEAKRAYEEPSNNILDSHFALLGFT
jgi:hypothetical protein